jgi:hypothetical protein
MLKRIPVTKKRELPDGYHLVQIESIFESFNPDSMDECITIKLSNKQGFIFLRMAVSPQTLEHLCIMGHMGGLEEGEDLNINKLIGISLNVQVDYGQVKQITKVKQLKLA